MAASAVYSKKEVEMVHEWTDPVTSGNMCEAHRAIVCALYNNSSLLLILLSKAEQKLTENLKFTNKHFNEILFEKMAIFKLWFLLVILNFWNSYVDRINFFIVR